MSQFIDQSAVVEALSALAQDTRMTAFQCLAAAYPASIGSGDLARGCKVPQNTMSTHLAILMRAGLVHVERAGRQRNYRADLDGMRAVVIYLARESSDGRSDLSASVVADPVAGKKGRKLSNRTNVSKPARKR